MNSISKTDPSSPIEILDHIENMSEDELQFYPAQNRPKLGNQSIVYFADTDLDEHMMNEVEQAAMMDMIDLELIENDEKNPTVRKRRHSCDSCQMCRGSCTKRIKEPKRTSNMEVMNQFKKNYNGGEYGQSAGYYNIPNDRTPVKPKFQQEYFTPPERSYVPKVRGQYRGCFC